MLLYVVVLTCFTTVFILVYGILYSLNYEKMLIKNRIRKVKELCNINQNYTEDKFLTEKVLAHFYNIICDFLVRITPEQKLIELNKKLERAGLLKNGIIEKWLFNKSMIMLITTISTGLLTYIVEPDISKSFIIAVIVMLFINTLLDFNISKKAETRKKIILKNLPYTLDLITVSVEAGASFDEAITRVVNNISGALSDEFAKCLKEIKMGIERKTALKNMSERCDVRELSMLINSLIQADELGVSLARVLRIEAANLREHRKQAAREKAMKAPVKMLFPLIFFIFPSIFVIVLGPAIIKIIYVFK